MDTWINTWVSGWPEMIAKGMNEGPEPIGDYLKWTGVQLKGYIFIDIINNDYVNLTIWTNLNYILIRTLTFIWIGQGF